MRLRYRDHRQDPAGWARALGVPLEAVELYLASDVIDLHNCSFVWARLGYDLSRRHRPRLRGTPVYNQLDFPRAREGAVSGMVWDITTNPFRPEAGRGRAFLRNLDRLRSRIARHPGELRLVRSLADYREARAEDKLACWVGVQGGNALDSSLDLLERIPGDLLSRVTLMHFTRSKIGVSSAARWGREQGLTAFGKRFVDKLVEQRIFVDLAHINRAGYFDALEVVAGRAPVLVTHTGVSAKRDVFRNIDDEQIRAVAETGGTIGIIYQASFIANTWYDYTLSQVVDHMQHVIEVAGEDHLSLGSDYDGFTILPRDLRDVTEQPRLVAEMLRRRWTPERIQKVLGGNYLRALAELDPGPAGVGQRALAVSK